MPDFEVKLEGGPTVTIELPELWLHTFAVDLQPGLHLVPHTRLSERRTAAVWIDYRP